MGTSELESRGFAITPNVVSHAQVDALVGSLAVARVDRSKAGARNLLNDPAASAVAQDPRLLQMASSALGAPAFAFKATLFDKSLRANWLVAWHQDTALPLKARRDVAGWGPWSVKAGVLYAIAPAEALSRIVHASSKASGPISRRVLHIEYATTIDLGNGLELDGADVAS